MIGPTLTFRTLFARALTIMVAVVAVCALVFFVLDGGWRELARSGPVTLFVVAGVWALFWNPLVEVSDGGITIVNVLRTTQIPWPTLAAVDTQWALRVHTDDGRRHSSWAVPASSGMGARTRRPSRSGVQKQPGDADRGSAAEGRTTISGASADAVALAIGTRLEALTEAGHLGRGTIGAVHPVVTWNREVLVVLGILAPLSVLGLTLG
ncbi:PH domain-containing protein [Occultella glacieicola]|uniref:PH domain-containing protein n=1 Tax=Occultella glacieicola TaxID=2518684 RepID=A0ABY2E2P3_9MICO|nr:PH domain-containing protein [Occultella glacieicola]TDE93894.1 PH domain-containing protein [Occultella glacieicola]